MSLALPRTLFAAALLLAVQIGAAAQAVGIQRLAWLQGCWKIDTPERVVEEQWSAPRAGSMLGTSRTVRGDKLVAHEFVLLRERGEQFAYEVQPSGQAPTVFLSVGLEEASVVFENLQHDFPQRVAYERKGQRSARVDRRAKARPAGSDAAHRVPVSARGLRV